MPVPYLEKPPKVIPIDVGRQLFVDDFLIENTTLNRTLHAAQKVEGNPVFKPQTKHELAVSVSGEHLANVGRRSRLVDAGGHRAGR